MCRAQRHGASLIPSPSVDVFDSQDSLSGSAMFVIVRQCQLCVSHFTTRRFPNSTTSPSVDALVAQGFVSCAYTSQHPQQGIHYVWMISHGASKVLFHGFKIPNSYGHGVQGRRWDGVRGVQLGLSLRVIHYFALKVLAVLASLRECKWSAPQVYDDLGQLCMLYSPCWAL